MDGTFRRHLLSGATVFGAAGSAVAQASPIRILAGLAAGGGNNEGASGQVLVDNKTAASGLMAADIVAKSPDGTTLMVAAQTTYEVAPQLDTSVALDRRGRRPAPASIRQGLCGQRPGEGDPPRQHPRAGMTRHDYCVAKQRE